LEEERLLAGDTINYCKYCERFERPPWVNCERESQEMMATLLKKVKGLTKVQMQSANFVWTEPHSKRLKVKVQYTRELNEAARAEVTEVVEFVEKYTQCPDCRKKFTAHDWIALIQVRQAASHKRTIHHLEQRLMQQHLVEHVLKSEEVEGGVDLFFASENEAARVLEFLKSRFPVVVKSAGKLVSYNERNNTANLKVTHSCQLPKVCRDDLVLIPRRLSKELGSCCQFLLCTKVSSYLHFLDPISFRKLQISATQYFMHESEIVVYTTRVYGRRFTVLDC
jgi:nonsense-mediated mRNA decay protein 3